MLACSNPSQAAESLIRFLDIAMSQGFDLRSRPIEEPTLLAAFDHLPRYSLEPGAEPSFSGYDCRGLMSQIAQEDDAAALERVLDAGFPIEAPIAFWRGGLLHLCAQLGAERCCRLLIRRGADLRALNDGEETPIFQAASQRQAGCALALIEAGSPWRREELPERRPGHPQALGSIALRSLGNDWSGNDWSRVPIERLYAGLVELVLALRGLGEPLERLFIIGPEIEAERNDLPPGLGLLIQARLDELDLRQALPPMARGGPCASL